jgi:hypothetical protein
MLLPAERWQPVQVWGILPERIVLSTIRDP